MADVCYPEITPELLRELLNYDPETGELKWKSRPREYFVSNRGHSIWNAKYSGKHVGRKCVAGNNEYIRFGLFYKSFWAHRVAWAIHYNQWPSGVIDHINQDGTDNRIENLRDTDRTVNCRNSRTSKRNKSGRKGVFKRKQGDWLASIQVDGKPKYLGLFRTKAEAIAARIAAESKLEGY